MGEMDIERTVEPSIDEMTDDDGEGRDGADESRGEDA
jgi:hypothetical protein